MSTFLSNTIRRHNITWCECPPVFKDASYNRLDDNNYYLAPAPFQTATPPDTVTSVIHPPHPPIIRGQNITTAYLDFTSNIRFLHAAAQRHIVWAVMGRRHWCAEQVNGRTPIGISSNTAVIGIRYVEPSCMKHWWQWNWPERTWYI